MKKLKKKMLLDLKNQIYNEIGEVLTINTQNFSRKLMVILLVAIIYL